MADTLRAKTAVSVLLREGEARALAAGESIAKSEVAEHVLEALKRGESYVKNLFEEGAGKVEKAEEALVDPGVVAMERTEKIGRERALLDPEERHGTAPLDVVPPRLDPGRTRPESGMDLVADEKYAAGSADTSEAGEDVPTQARKLAERRAERRSRRAGADQTETEAKSGATRHSGRESKS